MLLYSSLNKGAQFNALYYRRLPQQSRLQRSVAVNHFPPNNKHIKMYAANMLVKLNLGINLNYWLSHLLGKEYEELYPKQTKMDQ